MAPNLPGGAGSPTSKNSQLVILQGFPGFQETNKQSTRFSTGRITATDTHTEEEEDDDDDDDDDDGAHMSRPHVPASVLRALQALPHLLFATTLPGR